MRMLRYVVIAAALASGSAVASGQTPEAAAADRVAGPAAGDPVAEPEAPPPPAPYASPRRGDCDGLIDGDSGWQCGLRAPVAAELGVETKGCTDPSTAAAKRAECEAEIAKDAEWSAYLHDQAMIGVCNGEIAKDQDWHRELRLHFDQHMGLETPEAAKPNQASGSGSPAREKCNALLMSTPKWHARWKAEFEGINAYEFHDRESRYLTTNKQHVFGAYAAFLGLLVVFLVVLFLRQRRLVAEIAQLREDVQRAAAE